MDLQAVSIEQAAADELPAVCDLLKQVNLPIAGLAEPFGYIFIAKAGGQVIGSAAVELYGVSGLLRSVAVHPDARGRKIGRRLALQALRAARETGARRIYLLTETAADYFPAFGFRPIERSQVDKAVQQSLEFREVCPLGAQAMMLEVEKGGFSGEERGDRREKGSESDASAIRAEVQTYYGKVAERQSEGVSSISSCLSSASGESQSKLGDCTVRPSGRGGEHSLQVESCCETGRCGSALYVGEDLSELPYSAVDSSRGCGNPHAIATLQPGEVVLDLGSGGGLDVLLAARQVGMEGYVYGVDMTDKMLELARRNAARMGVANVEFRKGDLEDLPLGAHSVDVIISNCVVNLTPDKGNALREAFRVLKPGGRLAISDIVIDGHLHDLPVGEDQIRAGLSWAGCIAGALTSAEFRRLLEAAGFEKIVISVEQRYHASSFFSVLPPALRNLPDSTLDDLAQRFTSSSIQARKPRK